MGTDRGLAPARARSRHRAGAACKLGVSDLQLPPWDVDTSQGLTPTLKRSYPMPG